MIKVHIERLGWSDEKVDDMYQVVYFDERSLEQDRVSVVSGMTAIKVAELISKAFLAGKREVNNFGPEVEEGC